MATADLGQLYLRTDVSIAVPGSGWLSAADAVAAVGRPVFVLTAWNPGKERPGLSANRSLNAELHARLVQLGATVYPAIGAALDGTHYEESLAAHELERGAALALGLEFGQVAIFAIDRREQSVLATNGSWTEARPIS